jgi:RNA polymerase sigma-70 factor, ECF subfamily
VTPEDTGIRDANHEMDRQLVRDIAAGSAEALGRLYDRHAAAAFGLARRIVVQAEAAEEVVQDVFAQIWRDAARYERDRASVAGWIVMVTRTRAIDHLRARRARPDLARGEDDRTLPALPSSGRNPEQVTISTEEAVIVKRALGELPDSQRELLDLAYYEGLTHTEIADRTGIPLGTVKTRLRAAMTTLRDRHHGLAAPRASLSGGGPRA